MMTLRHYGAIGVIMTLLCCHNYAAPLRLNQKIRGDEYWPASSLPSHDNKHMHTNYLAFKPSHSGGSYSVGETPGSLACVYGLTAITPGCPIASATQVVTRGDNSKVIGIVDAFDNPQASNNLHTFSLNYGLPDCTTTNGCLTIVYASGTRPKFNYGWAIESSLDIEMAHAMAPNTRIILVEAVDNSNANLYAAEDVASNLVSAQGGGEVSNSWGGSELASELSDDSHFQTPGIIYFASTGDFSAPVEYPGASPFVVAAGGTSIIRDNNGLVTKETAWNRKVASSPTPNGLEGGAGGPSIYEPRPDSQRFVANRTGSARGTPDMAFDANPATGVWIYDANTGGTFCNGWCIIGGTSVSSPALAGIFNAAGPYDNRSTQLELQYVYYLYKTRASTDWFDVIEGNNGYPALSKYDFATGLGSPRGYSGL